MITAVTTCMGRRKHLELTLPRMLETFDKVILVDWSCPEGSGEYAASEGASVIYKYGEKHFSGSKAKNYGAKLVTSEYVAFIDADTMCMPGMHKELELLTGDRKMVLSARSYDGSDVNDTVGFLVCKTDSFWNVGGFDESWIGWGAEDIHLRGKLFLDERLEVVRLGPMTLGGIAHSNTLRNVNREAPIETTAILNHNTLASWFESKGISDYVTNPKVQDIVFHGQYPSHSD